MPVAGAVGVPVVYKIISQLFLGILMGFQKPNSQPIPVIGELKQIIVWFRAKEQTLGNPNRTLVCLIPRKYLRATAWKT